MVHSLDYDMITAQMLVNIVVLIMWKQCTIHNVIYRFSLNALTAWIYLIVLSFASPWTPWVWSYFKIQQEIDLLKVTLFFLLPGNLNIHLISCHEISMNFSMKQKLQGCKVPTIWDWLRRSFAVIPPIWVSYMDFFATIEIFKDPYF